MPIFKLGQLVELRSGRTGVIIHAAVAEKGAMSNIEHYSVDVGDPLDVKVMGTDIVRVLANANPSQKIKAVAKKHRTTGVWYSWGPANFNNLWIIACQTQRLMEHAIGIPKANQNLVGPGLYMARELWRSSVYAKPDATVLIIKLIDIPTIDIRMPNQMMELGDPTPPQLSANDLAIEKVNPASIGILARYLYIFTTNGNFSCLTAHKGVSISVDLGDVDPASLIVQADKVGMDAAQPLWNQASIATSPKLSAATRGLLETILKDKGAV